MHACNKCISDYYSRWCNGGKWQGQMWNIRTQVKLSVFSESYCLHLYLTLFDSSAVMLSLYRPMSIAQNNCKFPCGTLFVFFCWLKQKSMHTLSTYVTVGRCYHLGSSFFGGEAKKMLVHTRKRFLGCSIFFRKKKHFKFQGST